MAAPYNQGQYPPQQAGYPPQQGGMPPPQQSGYPPQQGGYPPQQGGMPPPQQSGYPPQQGGYPPQQGGMPPPQGGMPSQDDIKEPSAPSFGTVAGYEGAAGLDAVPAGPPPPYVPSGQPQERPEEHFDSTAQITDSQAHDALMEFVGQHCCYGKGAAKDMEIKDMKHSSAYHANALVLLVEAGPVARQNTKEIERGQVIDGPMNGRAPGPWEMQVQQPAPFAPTTLYQEIPHTASVQLCNYCHGTGHNRCKQCHGIGRDHCTSCSGSGHTHNAEGQRQTCLFCNGLGYKNCHTCHGRGRVTCHTCKGHGKLKVYLRLKVEWEIKLGQHVLERTDLPDELITQVSGTTIFAQEFPRVFPLTSFFESEINQASQNLVNTHAGFSQTGILHRQRHDLRSVPVNEIHCIWKDKPYRFWVYGTDHRVHCPDYPQQCCCGCVIL